MTGHYLERARVRAARRRSPWNLVLIPACIVPWAGLSAGLVTVVLSVGGWAGLARPEPLDAVGFTVTVLASVAGALPVALLAGNSVVWCVRPAREALHREAEPHPGTSFKEAQARLLKLTAVVTPVAFLIAVAGLLL